METNERVIEKIEAELDQEYRVLYLAAIMAGGFIFKGPSFL